MYRSRAQKISAPEQVEIIFLDHAPVRRVDKRYLSFSIDISVLVGGLWWEGSSDSKRGLGTLRVPPLRLDLRKLDRLVSALGPAYLRVGGSEADKIHYFQCRDEEEPDPLVLSQERWDSLHEFIQRNDLRFIFTCKYGLFRRKHHGNWEGSELEQLLRYSRDQDYHIDVFELGNELNAYWAFHGLRSQPGPKNLASDYDTFTEQVREYFPDAKISGPGSAFWPRLGETIRPFSNITPRFLASLEKPLDIVDWHYYPFQSERSPVRTRAAKVHHLVDPRSFEDYGKYCTNLAALRDAHQPQAEIWTGETGSAQCGGQPYLSDRWASSFWWADQLGMGASLGQRVMVRQALIGGDYGMVDRLTLKPRPDYWVSWMWGKLMGEKVYSAQSDHESVRVYLHAHPSGKGRTLLLINLNDDYVEVTARGGYVVTSAYVMTAKNLFSRKIKINGVKPEFRKGKVKLKDFPAVPANRRLPPYSISFWRLA